MPIKVINNTYTDIFGNTIASYKANAGDKVVMTTNIEANISITEIAGISISLDWINFQFQVLGAASWLQEGFRVGDGFSMLLYNKSDGALHDTRPYTASYVTDDLLRISESDGGFGASFDENLYDIRIENSNSHDQLLFNINHILNNQNAAFNSLIDGELTGVLFDGLAAMDPADQITGSIIGKQSGQYIIGSIITRNEDGYNSRGYSLQTTFLQSGIINPDWFSMGNCLKIATSLKFKLSDDDIISSSVINYTELANTGWYNTAFGTGVIDSVLTTGISEIDYASPTTVDIVVDSASTDLYLGASYVSHDDARYKNKVDTQQVLGLVLDAYVPLAIGTYSDFTSIYTIDVNSITTIGTTTTVNITFTPSNDFTSLFESFDSDDRLFYIWLRSGNVNHLAFSDQLTKTIDHELPLTIKKSFNRHNVNDKLYHGSPSVLKKSNTEDNIAFVGQFTIPPNVTYNGFRVSMVAKNSSTQEEFTLESIYYDFSTLQINSSGQYLMNLEQGVSNNLPSTSAKKSSTLKLDLGSNQATIYYPWVNHWEYWQLQSNASPDLYPNQNKNWVNYSSGDWGIKLKVSLENDIAYVAEIEIPITDYDTEPILSKQWRLYRENGDLVTALFANEIMIIEVDHIYTGYTAQSSWGEIKIEPFESGPSWLLSTVVPFDNNQNSPIYPISGSFITSTSSESITTFSCKLDTSKLSSLSDKIGSKFFGSVMTVLGLEFENGEPIQTENMIFLNTEYN